MAVVVKIYRQNSYLIIEDDATGDVLHSKYAIGVMIEPIPQTNLFRFYYYNQFDVAAPIQNFFDGNISDFKDDAGAPYTKTSFIEFYTSNTGEPTPIVPLPTPTSNFIDFTTGLADPAYNEGRVFYDDSQKTLAYYNEQSGTKVNLGQELVFKIYNNSGSTIMNGEAVRFNGTVVGSVPAVVKSLADTTENANVTGIATHDILDGQTGYITVVGEVTLDASAWSNGDILYVDSVTAGLLTNVIQPIVSRVAVVCDNDSITGCIIVASRAVEDPFAIGQSFNASTHVQALTTTPTPLEGFGNTPFEENIIITATPSGGSFRAIITPLNTAFTGFYEINLTLTIESSSNVIVIAEFYVNGAGTGLVGRADFGNNQTDEGTIVLTAFTQTVVTDSDTLEIFLYTDTGTTNITITNVVFNAKRLGTV